MAVATAKLNDAETLEDACAWLKPKERVAVLGDRGLIAMLARLPEQREPLDEAEGEAVGVAPRSAALSRRAVEQRKREQPGDEAADMGDPGDRRFGSAERLRAGAEDDIRRHPDRDEAERAPLPQQLRQRRRRPQRIGFARRSE